MAHGWLTKEGRLRAPWRIALYFALLFVLYVAGEYATSMLPRGPLGWTHYIVLTAAGLFAGWAMLVRFDGRAPGALGFALTRSALRETVQGFAIGGGLLAAAALLLFASFNAQFIPDTGTIPGYLGSLLWTLAYFGLAAAYEEVWFRGYAFQALAEGIGSWPTVVITSAIFSFFHAGNPNVNGIALFNIFLAGLLLGFAYIRTRSLWFATAVHAGWNWTMASLIGFPVSGLVLMDTPLYDAVETGTDWWTGGSFGPEAGLAGTAVLLPGLAYLLHTRKVSESPEMRALRPLIDTAIPDPSV